MRSDFTAKFGNYDWLPGYFNDMDVFILGGGPSLDGFDFSLLTGRCVIGINDAFRFSPIHAWVVIDWSYVDRTALDCGFDPYTLPVPVITLPPAKLLPKGSVAVFPESDRVVSDSPQMGLYNHFSGGSVALNAAMIGQARRIFLLGIDCAVTDKVHHFSGKLYHDRDIPAEAPHFTAMADYFLRFGEPDNVWNLSPISRIQNLKRKSVDEVFKDQSLTYAGEMRAWDYDRKLFHKPDNTSAPGA